MTLQTTTCYLPGKRIGARVHGSTRQYQADNNILHSHILQASIQTGCVY